MRAARSVWLAQHSAVLRRPQRAHVYVAFIRSVTNAGGSRPRAVRLIASVCTINSRWRDETGTRQWLVVECDSVV